MEDGQVSSVGPALDHEPVRRPVFRDRHRKLDAAVVVFRIRKRGAGRRRAGVVVVGRRVALVDGELHSDPLPVGPARQDDARVARAVLQRPAGGGGRELGGEK